MKKIWLLSVPVFALLFACSFFSPKPSEDGIKWMTWQQMQEAQKVQKRKVFIDVYTGWCGWCKRMDATSFTNPTIVGFMNDNFYAIKFDAETRETINFAGKDYKFVPDGYRGYNELAAYILNGQMSYPTSVYLDEDMNVIFPVAGYQEPKMLEQVLNYVQGNNYKSMSFDEFNKTFKGKIQ